MYIAQCIVLYIRCETSSSQSRRCQHQVKRRGREGRGGGVPMSHTRFSFASQIRNRALFSVCHPLCPALSKSLSPSCMLCRHRIIVQLYIIYNKLCIYVDGGITVTYCYNKCTFPFLILSIGLGPDPACLWSRGINPCLRGIRLSLLRRVRTACKTKQKIGALLVLLFSICRFLVHHERNRQQTAAQSLI